MEQNTRVELTEERVREIVREELEAAKLPLEALKGLPSQGNNRRTRNES